MAQDNKDNFLYENVKTASSVLPPSFRARFKNIMFLPSGIPNTDYTPIPGNTSGGINSVAPYNPLVNDTQITTYATT
ncbi:MAG: hypothetical protein ACKPDM_13580 [Dolichospermum sp.]